MAYVDLTRPIRDGMPVYPGDPPVDLAPTATMADDGYRVTELACGSHAGTHVDAPRHVLHEGDPLDAFDVGRFVFDARLVDLTGLDSRQAIAPADLPASDESPTTDLLVIRTGWESHWGTDRYADHPYLAPAAAERCAAAGWSVALDTFGPDPTPSPNAGDGEPDGVPAHRTLLGAECFIVENLTNLDALDHLDADRFTLYAFPLALAGADGAPVRAVADVSPE